ncbi:fructose-6-phosphate aldolase [Candidatus Peregrinibacteria bacterium]|nr:fructose-6-phosphate aldolase [Candidatus Peregrinibacteria bacterium]
MKLFLDTADLVIIQKYAAWGLVDGVTTNPSLIAKEGMDLEKRVKEIASIIHGPISAEVLSTEAKDMIEEGRRYAKWASNICIKCPMTPNGLLAAQTLSKEGIAVNVTLVFSAAQALLAAKAGAAFVSPFVGRVDDAGQDGMELISEIIEIYKNYQFKTEIIVASIRSPRQVALSAIMGAHVCTIPPDIYGKLFRHPLTDQGIKKFLDDWSKAKKK